MIYIFLSSEINIPYIKEIQLKIIEFLKIQLNNVSSKNYKIIYFQKHIIEKYLPDIKTNDYILWHPNVAANNLSIVKKYINSYVILKHKTVLLQKLSERNPINENMALNNNFGLLYIEEYNDLTNSDWKLIVNPKITTIEEIIIKINTHE